jgi:UDP-N-acetylglucosamine 2-epimerase (non-hydrolysing)
LRLGIIVGTRPEIIKMSPVVRQCQVRGLDFFVLHTGQHDSHNMNGVFFEQLRLPVADFSLNIGSGGFSHQIGQMLVGIEGILSQESPDYVLGEGDTNSVLAAALVSTNLRIPFVHVEAGLRSYNLAMQEERNRIIADQVADVLFPPTIRARDILVKEGVSPEKIVVTGNTISDAVLHYLPKAHNSASLEDFDLRPQEYFLATLHRAENADHDQVLRQLLASLEQVSETYQIPVIFPVHPRTKTRIEDLQIRLPNCIRLIDPVGFYEFLVLEENARLVLTDSGGVQEECCILRVPCITLRDDTERPETIEVGGNILAGRMADQLSEIVPEMLGRPRDWANPFGDGDAAGKMLDALVAMKAN